MHKVDLTEDQLALLNGTNDVEELSLSDLFAIAGGTNSSEYYY